MLLAIIAMFAVVEPGSAFRQGERYTLGTLQQGTRSARRVVQRYGSALH